MSYFNYSLINNQLSISSKPVNLVFAYNFDLNDLNPNVDDFSYNFLLNYATNKYDGSLNNIAGIVSSPTPPFGSGCYYGNNGIYGMFGQTVRAGNWMRIPSFVIPTATLNSGISISLWVNLSGSVGTPQRFFIFNTAADTNACFSVYFTPAGGTSTLATQNSGIFYNYNYKPIGTLNDDNWHHIVFTYQLTQNTPTQKTTLKIYIDNKLVSTTIYTGRYIVGNMNYCYIGSLGQEISNNAGIGTSALQGYLDNFRFYNSALNTAQIDRLYSSNSV